MASVPAMLRFEAERMSYYDERIEVFKRLATDIDTAAHELYGDMTSANLRRLNGLVIRALRALEMPKSEYHDGPIETKAAPELPSYRLGQQRPPDDPGVDLESPSD